MAVCVHIAVVGAETFKYASVWALILLLITFSMLVIEDYRTKPLQELIEYNEATQVSIKKEECFTLWKVTHILFETSFTVSLTITVLFWALIFPSLLGQYKLSVLVAEGIADHLVPLLVCIGECLMNKIQFRWPHFIIGPLLFSLVYCVFTVIMQ